MDQTIRNRFSIPLIAVVLTYLAIELLSFLSIIVLRETRGVEYWPIKLSVSEERQEQIERLLDDRSLYAQQDPDLGWSIRKNGYSGDLYRANADGIRADRDYPLTPPDGVLRIATFGDSFTHSDDVRNEHTWQTYMESRKPGLEVLNFGVGAYGLDQAFLRFERDGRKYNPHIVLIGFMSENIYRNVSVYRPFYIRQSGAPLTKPRFRIARDKLDLLGNPLAGRSDYQRLFDDPASVLKQIGKDDWHYNQRPKEGAFDILPSIRIVSMATYEARRLFQNEAYDEDSELFQLTLRIFDAFYDSVIESGAEPVIVLFPRLEDVKEFRKTGSNVFTPMHRYFESSGYRYIDLHDAFDAYASDMSIGDIFIEHYSPAGNEIVARFLALQLGIGQ